MRYYLAFVFTVLITPGAAFAADRHTCKMIEKLMEATDKGLVNTAAGKADRQPVSGIATYAREAQSMAEKFSTKDPLPDNIIAALTAIADTASSHYFIAAAAPLLLEHGLTIQNAMPQICPGTNIPDLRRHAN
jgi:hypothetical protein